VSSLLLIQILNPEGDNDVEYSISRQLRFPDFLAAGAESFEYVLWDAILIC